MLGTTPRRPEFVLPLLSNIVVTYDREFELNMYRTRVLMVSLQLIRCEAVVVTCEPTNKSRADPWSSSTRTPHDEVIRAALARPVASSFSSYWAQPPTPPLASSSCVSSTTTSDVGSTFSSPSWRRPRLTLTTPVLNVTAV